MNHTGRESLRDIEASLSASSSKLYAMGFRSAVKRSTLADANGSRDVRLWLGLAALLIRRARQPNRYYPARRYPEHLRRIRSKDSASGTTPIFRTNTKASPSLTITALYKRRRQVELFFTWIAQHLRIKHFLGNKENAVKTRVWCAATTYVLIAIVKKELQLDASLCACLQILPVQVFEKTHISCALQADASQTELPAVADQLNWLCALLDSKFSVRYRARLA